MLVQRTGKSQHERVHELLKASKAAKLPERKKWNKLQRTESNKEANRRESDSSSDEDSGTYCVDDYFLENETPQLELPGIDTRLEGESDNDMEEMDEDNEYEEED